MKRIFIPLLFLAAACSQPPKDHFVLRGTVPGAMDSTEVVLTPVGETWNALARGYVLGERFELQGKLPYPTCCRLSLNNGDIAERRGIQDDHAVKYVEIEFFAENGDLVFSTPHIDSLPRSFWQYDIRKEKNYSLKGSPAQDVFCAYQQQTIPLRYEIRTREQAYMDSENFADYKAAAAARELLEVQNRDFIRANGNLYVNLYLAEQLKRAPFTYDRAYLNGLAALFAEVQDTCAPLRQFRDYLQGAAAFAQGKPLEDGTVLTPESKEQSLLSQLNPESYTFIDFWASWCGPCRASFPHLREMYKQYGERVRFLSISLDSKEADWLKAMDEEQLPWAQFLASPELSKAIGTLYDITAIPTFLLINPQGAIVFSGHDSGALELQLEVLE